jgi:CHAT domain-containing protein
MVASGKASFGHSGHSGHFSEQFHCIPKMQLLSVPGLKRHPCNPLRVWWCATGPLAFLAIHAAGIYGQKSFLSFQIRHLFLHSVSALLGKIKGPKPDRATRKFLLISQSNTAGFPLIPGTKTEVQAILERITQAKLEGLHLEEASATVSKVIEEMPSHGCIHLACHASQDISAPLNSGFCLHDGRLTLSEVNRKQHPQADFAFLSARQTSAGDEKLSEEAVHLAARMLAAGYRGVVATMGWRFLHEYS